MYRPNKYILRVIAANVGSHSAQLLQFGPLVRIMQQHGEANYVPFVTSAYWLGAASVSLWVGKLLDRLGPKKVILFSIPIILCPWGYLFTDYRLLIMVRVVHGILIAFLSATITLMLRKLLPSMKEPKNRPQKWSETLTRAKQEWREFRSQGWRRTGDPHKKGMALNATLTTWVATLVFSTLGYEWVSIGWPLVGWAGIASMLFLVTVGSALLIPQEQLQQHQVKQKTLHQAKPSIQKSAPKHSRRVELFFSLIPGIGMGVIGTVLSTYLPLYTSLVAVSLIMLVKRVSDNLGAWLVAYLPSNWDRMIMGSGIILTGIGTLLLWASNQPYILFISVILLGIGVEAHRTTMGNKIYEDASAQQKGLAVAINSLAFQISCFIGTIWGLVADIVGYKDLWLTTLPWLILPISAFLWERKKNNLE